MSQFLWGAILPDNPIQDPEADLLGRRTFAESIANLIDASPAGSSTRIGVFGGWGEGKTSILLLTRGILENKGHVCVWLVPWVTDSREAIADQLTIQIAEKLGLNLKRLRTARHVLGLANKARERAQSDVKLWVFDAIFGPALERRLHSWVERQGEALAQAITEALGSRKLVVFVDDVDRVRPDLVPSLLLTIREALDRPDFFYVMALAPDVIESGLKAMHASWGSPGDFLEKIIEIPRYLPLLSDDDVRRYTDALIKSVDSAVDTVAVEDIQPLLPHNPRRLKLFMRYVATLAMLVGRFSKWEIDLHAFYILQLLQLEFPNEIRRALMDQEVVRDLQEGSLRDIFSVTARKTDTDAKSQIRPELKFVEAHPQKERFLQLCEAIRQRGLGAWTYYPLVTTFQLPENPPVLTYKEGVEIIDEWLGVPTLEKDTLLSKRLSVDGILDRRKCRAFWHIQMNIRNLRMTEIIDEALEERIQKGLGDLSSLNSLASSLAIGIGGFRDELLSVDEWKALYQLSAKWAHFRSPEYYAKVRKEERDLLLQSFGDLNSENKAALYPILKPSQFRDEPRKAPEFVEVVRTLANESGKAAISVLLERFVAPDGLDSLWARDSTDPQKLVLFQHDSSLYQEQDRRRTLLDLALRAKENEHIQLNFLTFFRQLAYGATEPSSFPADECRKILRDSEVLSAIWTAALARPLNPRIVGSLRPQRNSLIRTGLLSPEAVAIPQWWAQLEAAGFWKNEPEESVQ